MKKLGIFVVLAAALALPPQAAAQSYFGKNQVQYDRFKWRVLETEHFLIHYYPEEEEAVRVAASLAERSYERISRILDHRFKERKPIVLFASRSDFGQNNVLGDLGEFTGGVTEALRHRILMPFTGDFGSFEEILTHEMVHAFQYDIFARGKAGAGLQQIAQVNPPLWFMEGMAVYLSVGRDRPSSNTQIRDAALNGRLPTIEQMTQRPDRFNPYLFGDSFWGYVGDRWGDDVIGRIMHMVPSHGVERAFRRELGMTLEEAGEHWKEAMQQRHLPMVASLERVRSIAQPMLTERRSKGQIFLAPTLSSDGQYVAFLSNGSFLRGEVFIDLWLGNATSGRRVKRLVKSALDPNFEELRLMYAQSAFSHDGRYLAFTAQRQGKDVLYLLDVESRRTVKRFDTELEGVTSPSWSPDSRRIVFSGNRGGMTDLYIVDADGTTLRRLTNDRYAALQPSWSPDGRTIAFATDRGSTDMSVLRFGPMRIALLDLETLRIEVIPGQEGLNKNPQWSPDGQSIAYMSDRTGTENIFLYERAEGEHYQLTDVVGGVTGVTSLSPAITWARQADKLAFTYFEDGNYTVWAITEPRRLKKQPVRRSQEPERPLLVEREAPAMTGTAVLEDSVPRSSFSYYRNDDGVRLSAQAPPESSLDQGISVAAIIDSTTVVLPDTTTFRDYGYKVRFQPDYVARPSIGYAQDNFGRGVYGGTAVILSDMLGNHRMALAGEVNGSFSEARLFAAYLNLERRLQYGGGALQNPYYFLSGETLTEVEPGLYQQDQLITRYIVRQAFGNASYPFNRFARAEFGLRFTNIDRATLKVWRFIDVEAQTASPYYVGRPEHHPGINYASPFAAYVFDNTLFGFTGPISGQRYRLEIEPALGSFRWVDYTVDYRRYDPILFNYLTVATRVLTSIRVGRDEQAFVKYIGRPEFVRGYDRENFYSPTCNAVTGGAGGCSAAQLVGSRVALANAELRFPLIRRVELGLLPIMLPPLDGLFFYDIGMAWSTGQTLVASRPDEFDDTVTRFPLRSYGFGLRLNVYNYFIVRWDYARPLDAPTRDGFWTWSIGPSF